MIIYIFSEDYVKVKMYNTFFAPVSKCTTDVPIKQEEKITNLFNPNFMCPRKLQNEDPKT